MAEIQMVNDRLYELGWALAEIDRNDDAPEKRLLYRTRALREALMAAERVGYQRGYADASIDLANARMHAEDAAARAGAAEKAPDA